MSAPEPKGSSQETERPVEVAPPGALRLGVIGVGRMGRHHARVCAETAGATLVGVVDPDEERRETIAEARGCGAFASAQELKEAGVDAVLVAAPTSAHAEIARPFLEAGVACLVEKPLARDGVEAQALVELAERTGAVLQVGHTERFNPVVRALRRLREESHEPLAPRFIEVHRVSPMTFRSVDVSVVADMMIHDLDVVMMLTGGREPIEIRASGVAVITECADVCNARLTFETPSGPCVANITASRLALKTERKMRVIGEEIYCSVDYAKKSGVVIRRTANTPQLEQLRESLRRGADLSDLDYHDLVAVEDLEIDDQEPLRMQLDSFLKTIRARSRPEVDAEAGLAAVRTAERIEEAIGRAG